MWKLIRAWTVDDGLTEMQWYKCSMKIRFSCGVHVEVIDSATHITPLQRVEHDENSHSHDRDKSKNLKIKRHEAIRSILYRSKSCSNSDRKKNATQYYQSQSGKHIDPKLAHSVRGTVWKFRLPTPTSHSISPWRSWMASGRHYPLKWAMERVLHPRLTGRGEELDAPLPAACSWRHKYL